MVCLFLISCHLFISSSNAIEVDDVSDNSQIAQTAEKDKTAVPGNDKVKPFNLNEEGDLGSRSGVPVKQQLNNREAKVMAYFRVLRRRYSVIAERYGKIIARIESRLSKMQSNNLDVAIILTKLDQTKTKLASTQQEIEGLEASVSAIFQTSDPKAGFFEIKNSIKAVKEEFKTINELLTNVVTEMISIISKEKIVESGDTVNSSGSAQPIPTTVITIIPTQGG